MAHVRVLVSAAVELVAAAAAGSRRRPKLADDGLLHDRGLSATCLSAAFRRGWWGTYLVAGLCGFTRKRGFLAAIPAAVERRSAAIGVETTVAAEPRCTTRRAAVLRSLHRSAALRARESRLV